MEELANSAPFTRRILVTGGAGFIGSHVVIHLVKTYPRYYIVNLDSLDYCSCVRNVHTAFESAPNFQGTRSNSKDSDSNECDDDDDKSGDEDDDEDEVGVRLRGSFCEWDIAHGTPGSPRHLPKNYKFIKGDITSADLIEYILCTEKIDTILHFAAQSHVDNSFGNSIQFSQTNIIGTHVLLEEARIHGKIQRFIHVSTDEVYGEGQAHTTAMLEDHALEPTNPYAATKAGAEFLVKAYQRSFKLPTIITRSNNVYGPHQYPEKLVPKFINQVIRRYPLTIHGDGTNTRNYLYISDVVAAFDLILHQGTIGEIYNIGGQNELSNKQVALDILRLMNSSAAASVLLDHMISNVSDRPFNDMRYTIDSTKLRAIGWSERVSWEEGLKKTIKWYRRHGHRFGNIEHALAAHPGAFRKTYQLA
ncbi:TPA: hypothetical protein N0F65_009056 [Lagenidium giganteum]|uniref:NAD(P)-binding domain-containing protein n=1 Tax=Lagenidium giganteum TaxID=4803 RepID=A0AAV2YJD0_9STRA|nr:TPA: hypothetical protein N0F65_009056 [Lagenidium giganteum]